MSWEDWREAIPIMIYLVIVYILGFIGGLMDYNELKDDYSKLEEEYNNMKTEYKWQLESCYQLMGDMQDDYDVNNDGEINAQDYVAIKEYIMNK